MSTKNEIKKLVKQQKLTIRKLQNKIDMQGARKQGKLSLLQPQQRKRKVNTPKRKRGRRNSNEGKDFVPAQVIESQILGDSSNVVNSTQTVPQINIVEVSVDLNVDALTKIGYAWSLYAISKDVLAGQTVVVNGQQVGIMYMSAATIAFDLWAATKNNLTCFTSAPRAYWELRSALTPKIANNRRMAFSYSFTSAETFIGVGGMYPLGFPLVTENVSLSWPSNVNIPQATMNTVVPTLDDNMLYDFGPAIVQKMWTLLKVANGAPFVLEVMPDLTAFSKSTAAFSCCYDYSTPENQDWTLFSHELKINGWEEWLAVLGLGFGSSTSSNRRGPITFSEYKGPGSYMHRLYSGHVGRQSKQVIRYKNVYLESFLAAITGAVTVADTIATDQNGGVTMIQPNTSRLLEVSAAQYTNGLLQGILKGFSSFNFVGAFQVTCDTCFITAAGTTQVPSQACLTMALPNFYNEMRASLVPKVNKRKGWEFVTYPILVTAGLTTANVYENDPAGDASNLKSILKVIYANMNEGASTWVFGPDTSTLPEYFNAAATNVSWVEGTAYPDAITATSSVHNQLQGNLMMSTPMANFHTIHTLVYYTCILEPVGADQGYSQYQNAKLRMITNRVPFSANDVSYDLMNVLPSSFMNPNEYRSIYSETSSLDYADEQTQTKNILMTVSGYAHVVAGEGTETTISHISFIAQSEGGGFVNLLKKAGRSLLPAIADGLMPGSGDIAGDLLDAVIGS